MYEFRFEIENTNMQITRKKTQLKDDLNGGISGWIDRKNELGNRQAMNEIKAKA